MLFTNDLLKFSYFLFTKVIRRKYVLAQTLGNPLPEKSGQIDDSELNEGDIGKRADFRLLLRTDYM